MTRCTKRIEKKSDLGQGHTVVRTLRIYIEKKKIYGQGHLFVNIDLHC